MIHFVVEVRSVICEAVNAITVPVSVLFPGKGTGLGLGIGPWAGRVKLVVAAVVGALVFCPSAQLMRSAALARMQI